MTVTAEVPAAAPRSWASGSHGLSSSSSAMQNVTLPGWPSVERSIWPGMVPRTFIKISRMARPMLAFARLPLARTLWRASIPSCVRIGPLTTMNGALPPVLADAPCRLYAGAHKARTIATNTGM